VTAPPSDPLPLVGIVILNWNGYRVSHRCLESLRALDYPAATTYLLDNGSTDDSWARLKSECAREGVVFIQNGSNLGFSGGCNPGIVRAMADGCDYVLLLNNDTIAADGTFLRHMVELAESDPRCGVVGGRLRLWPETDTLWGTGGTIWWAGEHYIGAGEKDRDQYAEVEERRFISGALMLIRRAVLDGVGLLPEAYFFGYEDKEYSVLVRRNGWRMLYQPRAIIYHEAGHSHEAIDPVWIYNDTASKALFKKRTLSSVSWALWYVCYALYLRALLKLRARWLPGQLMGGIPVEQLRAAMIDGFRDGARATRVTLGQLSAYRARVASRPVDRHHASGPHSERVD
jgi:GT2 family glycosyltransferase